MKDMEIVDEFGREFIAVIEMKGNEERGFMFKVETVHGESISGRYQDGGFPVEKWSSRKTLISIDDISTITNKTPYTPATVDERRSK